MQGANNDLVKPSAGPLPSASRSGVNRPGSEVSLTVRDVARVLKKHTILILGVFLFFVILAGVGTYFWAKLAPTYTAVGYLDVESPAAPKPMKGDSSIVNTAVIEAFMNTQAKFIESPAILQQLFDEPFIKQTKWYQSFGGDVDRAMTDMRKRLSASVVRDTWLIAVSFVGRDADEAAKIVNLVLTSYYLDKKRSLKRGARSEIDDYTQKALDLQAKIADKILEQERFRASQDIPFMEKRRAAVGDEVLILNTLLTQALVERDQAQSQYDEFNRPGVTDWLVTIPEVRNRVNSDPMVQNYTTQLGDLGIELQVARQRGANHRVVGQLELEYTTVKRKLYSKKLEVMTNVGDELRENAWVRVDTNNMRVVELRDRLLVAKANLSAIESLIAKYFSNAREIKMLQEQLGSLRDYLLGLQVQLDDPRLIRVTISSRATRPLVRSAPNFIMNMLAGVMIGLVFGVGLAFLLEFLSNKVKSPADVGRQLKLALLGQIPSQDDDETAAEDMNQLLVDSPHSLVSESFRQLRANLLFCAPEDHQKSMLITSCSPGEGKSCIAVNLATSFALAGRRVLLVDANFRRPSVAKSLGMGRIDEGLSNILIGHDSPESLIHKTSSENLDIMSSGPLPPNPSELLSGKYLREFITRFSGQYDLILFDAPPILVVSDVMVLASAMDGVLMVVRSGVSSRGAILRAKGMLQRAGVNLFGVVLNDVKSTRGGYFREMYKTYYEYQFGKSHEV